MPFLVSGICQAQTAIAGEQAGIKPLTIVNLEELSATLRYVSPRAEFTQYSFGDESYYDLSLADHNFESEPGMPALPVYSTIIDLTGRKIEAITIHDIKTSRIYPLSRGFTGKFIPAREPGIKDGNDQEGRRQNGERPFRHEQYYNSANPYITDTVIVDHVGIIRGNKIANLRINPVIYYPADNFLDIITEMTIEITFSQEIDYTDTKGSLKSASISSLLAKGIINYDPEDVIPGFSLNPVGMVVVSDTSMKRHLLPLINWKRRKGFAVTEIYIGENGITRDFLSIKEALTGIYNNATNENPAPEYLILAGDLNYIPASQGTTWLSDMYYAEFDGNGDYLPDMYTGRLPARDTTQMKAMVSKILQYEQFAFGDTIKHYKSALAFTGYDLSNINIMNGQVKYAGSYLNESNGITSHIMLHNTNDSIRTVRYDSVKVLLNSGVGFINYTGHGDTYGWLNTGINYNTVSSLTNKSRYPVIISNACQTANYSNINCFGSAFVRQKEKGALAFIGCSNDSYWTEDYYWAVGVTQVTDSPTYEESGPGFYDRWFHLNGEIPSYWHLTLGQVLFAGNMAVSESTSSKKKYYWETYTLLGDPSIIPYIGNPLTFNESLPDSIPRALKKLTLNTEPFAYVAVSHSNSLWDASNASPTGAVNLDIPDLPKDSCTVIITGQNRIPYIKTLYFSDPDTAWLSINDISPNDITGNNNGLADFSENISLNLELQNAGGGASEDTYILLESASDHLVVISDSVYLGSIAALSELSLENLFSVVIDDSIPDLHIVSFNLTLHNGNYSYMQAFDLSLHGPSPVILNCYTDDSVTGNGNNMAEAGEKISIIIRVTNNGSSAVSGLLYLQPLSDYIEFDENTLSTGLIAPGMVLEIPVYATIGSDTPEATSIGFSAHLDCYPYSASKELSIYSGKSTEDFELQNFTTFPWKNNSEYPWIIAENESFRNFFSARSGLSSTSHNQKSVLSLHINLPVDDTMSFWYKVSSEYNYDWFSFEIDSLLQFRESGQTDWIMAKVPLKKGVHLLNWIYTKDPSLSEGFDCAWIDFVRFPELSFLKNDISLNRILSPKPYMQYHDEKVSVEITNLGRDTITSLNLSYTLNDDSPVEEQFFRTIEPGDTVILTFSSFADLAEPGNYFIDIFNSYADEYSGNDTLRAAFISYNYLIQVGPNPFDERISFISQGHYEDITVRLYSMRGILMHEQKFEQFLPGEMVNMEIPYLGAGIYILKVHTALGTSSYKLIKR